MAPFWNRLRASNGSGSRKAAKERLQLVLITDRSDISPDKLQAMRDEIIAVISKYAPVDMGRIEIKIEQRQRDNFLVADVPLSKDAMKREGPQSTGLEDS